jgi:fused signal recognition particle receptor
VGNWHQEATNKECYNTRMANIFSKWAKGLEKTRKVTFGRIATFFGATEINNDTWDELEAILIQADLGVETVMSIINAMQSKVQAEGLTQSGDLMEILQRELISMLVDPPELLLPEPKPHVILMVGVNGSGKTTSAAKLGYRFQQEGKSVIFGAADTYRAAAIEQLQVWAKRLNAPIIAGQTGGDSGAVAFDTVKAAISRGLDIAIIDTAGRLHTRYNLMEELQKVYRVTGKALEGAPSAVWLVLDATTGQNALQQAKSFKEAVHVDGIILTKLDSSARGGMVFSIQKELGLPILYTGLGETFDDLVPFDRKSFIEGIFPSKL